MDNSSTSVVSHGDSQPKTTSRCVTESVTGTHDFELINYPLLDGIGVGKLVSSSVFTVGGYDWTIRFYPDGFKENGCAFASAYLCSVTQPKEVRAKFALNMLEKEGKVQLTNYGLSEHTFSPASYDWGFVKFVVKSKLKSSTSINNGYLTIRSVLTVVKEPRSEAKKSTVVVVPQPNLQGHLQQMWKDGQGADVTFSVGGQLFNAHRCLLAARSPVVKAELFGPMKEKETQCIKIDDIEPTIFEALLHFVYTDSMLDDEHYKEGETAKLQHLLVAADQYGLDRLRVMCESKLCKSIDVETVATTLVLVEQHHCKDLSKVCFEFMIPPKVLRIVMATDGFRHLVPSCPSVMEGILDKVSRSE